MDGPSTNPGDHLEPWFLRSPARLHATLFVTLALPAVLLFAFVLFPVRSHVAENGRDQVSLIGRLLAGTVDHELGSLKAIMVSTATRPSLVSAVEEARPESVTPHLQSLVELSPRFSRAFITDPEGVELYDHPHDPNVIGVSFAHRDWYRGVTGGSGAYISEVYQRAALDQPLVVAVATPIRRSDGRVTGYLVGQYALADLQEQIAGLTLGDTVSLALVDQSGRAVAGPGEWDSPDLATLSHLAMEGPRTGRVALGSGDHVVGLAAVPAAGWTAIAYEPLRAVHAPVQKVLGLIPLVFLACLSVTAVLAGIGFKTLRRYSGAWRRSEQALIEATRSAQAASRAKSEFLAVMSHELRTPLNGVIGMVELLRHTGLDGRQRRFAEACHASARSLLQIINDILDFSKIESGRLDLDDEEFVLTQCVDDAVALTAHRAHENGLELNYYVEPEVRTRVRGDSLRLRQVLVNLLSNAIKFTEEGQVILRFMLESRTRDHMVVRCTLTDSGIGIPANRLDRVFKAFSQVERRTTHRYGGTGLGLSICKSLVEAMDGEIGVESEAGQGSTFWFTARFETADSRDLPPLAPADLRGMRVALISGNAESRAVLTETLSSWEMQVDWMEPREGEPREGEAREGEPVRGRGAFNLVILDVPVGVESEEDVRGLVRAHEHLAPRAIVLHPSSAAVPDDMSDEGAASWFLRKPPSPSELHDRLLQACCGAPPSKVSAQPDAGDGADPEQRGPRCRVLLAEDHPTSQLYVSEILRQSGYDCDVVGNGREVVEAVQRASYHVILMDCQMPELDGFGATAEIRALEAAGRLSGRTPIIALTANAIKGDRERCIEAGMDDYLSKPVEPRALLSKLAERVAQAAADQPAPSAPEPGPDAPPLDPEAALRRCMGNAELLAAALASFAQETPGTVDQLIAAAGKADLPAVARHAHSVKGASGLITAARLSEIARAIEEAAGGGAQEDIAGRLEGLRAELRRVLAFIESRTSDSAPAPAAPGDSA